MARAVVEARGSENSPLSELVSYDLLSQRAFC